MALNRRGFFAGLFALPIAAKFANVAHVAEVYPMTIIREYVIPNEMFPVTLTLDQYAARYMSPAIERMVTQIEDEVMYGEHQWQ